MTADGEPFQARTEGTTKVVSGEERRRRKRQLFIGVNGKKRMEVNPTCLSGLPEFDLGGFFFS